MKEQSIYLKSTICYFIEMQPSEYLASVFSLEGKVAVVIGGTGELCGAMAEGLAAAGAVTVLVGRSEEKAAARIAKIEAAGGKAYFEKVDVNSKASIAGLLDAVLEKSGKVDILVNGAGVNSPTPIFDIEEEEFDNILNTNLKAVLFASQIFGKYLVERGEGGSIINVGSMSGIIPLSRVFTYSATKAAVHNLSKNLAREWAESKVRVNTIVPGFFPAEQNKKVLTPERVASIMGHTPANRFGEAHELIGATLLLASEASSFMNGAELVVDGGYASMTI
jgi:NAD(P)-dependent dehydrogenase (short-subunit alcohol dehydrogenase family)